MSVIDKKILYINWDSGDVIDSEGAIKMDRPTISYGSAPVWQLNFVRVQNDNSLSGIDLSNVVSYHAAVDTDFLSATLPMVRTLDSDIDHSLAASGIISVNLNACTETFFNKVDGRNTVPAYFEVRGNDSDDKCILDYRFPINALGAVDPQGGDPIPVASGGVTINDVYALLRSAPEYQYSDNGTNWHPTQQSGDIYYQTRYDGGDWSSTIEMIKGADGTDGEDGTDGTNGVGFKVVGEYNAGTTYHPYTTSGYYEVVTHNGSSYAYINSTASSGHEPSGTDSYWELIAAKGDTGSVDNITVSDITDFDSTMSGILSGYAQKGESYTVAQSNTLLAAKANASDVYTIEEADNKFVDVDELSEATGNLVTLPQWNQKNAQLQGEINYLSGQISGSGYDSDALTGVYLNNEPCFEVSNRAYVIALAITTSMPNATDSRQTFIMYLGPTDTSSATEVGGDDRHIKGHIYERIPNPSMAPPTYIIGLTITQEGVESATLTETNNAYHTATGVYPEVSIANGTSQNCEDCWVITINGTTRIVSDACQGIQPWEATGWKYDISRESVDVLMTVTESGGGGASSYVWKDISPWATTP